MFALNETVERNHRMIIASLGGAVLFFLAACLLHDVLPICHYVFGCDHRIHATG